MSRHYLLDTSAVLAFVDGEEGADEVEDLLRNAAEGGIEVDVCSASLMELYYVSLQEDGEEEAAGLIGLVRSWPVTWVRPRDKDLLLGGRLKAFHRLSFADALIAATSKNRGATLIHKDPELESLQGTVPQRPLPYKTS